MKKKQRSDSATALVTAAQAQARGYTVPDGLCQLTERERIAWRQYSVARGSWKEAELRILHRAVKLETDLETLQEEARVIPAVYTKPSGDLGEHPVHVAVRSRLKSLQSELRMIGLQCSPDRKAGVGNSGRFVTQANLVCLASYTLCWPSLLISCAIFVRFHDKAAIFGRRYRPEIWLLCAINGLNHLPRCLFSPGRNPPFHRSIYRDATEKPLGTDSCVPQSESERN